jgi:hypothetical protein
MVWFDEAFRAAGARTFLSSAARMAAAAGIWAILGTGLDWRTAGFWTLAVVLIEWPLREITRPMARGLTLNRAEAAICLAIYAVAVAAWSGAGAILWSSGHGAWQLAGAAVFVGQLLYLEVHHGRSLGALAPAAPGLAAPLVVLLWAPHVRGLDQGLAAIILLASVALAAVGVAGNFQGVWPPRRTGLELRATAA